MDIPQIILELMALEKYFEQGRQRCYSLRKDLESFSTPAPSGEAEAPVNKMVIDAINKRRKAFIKKNG